MQRPYALYTVDRQYTHKFFHTLLYYNLEKDFDYIVVESSVSDVPENMPLVVVLPSTIPDLCKGRTLFTL